MRYMQILGFVADEAQAQKIKEMLENTDMQELQSRTCPKFEEWLEELPDRPMEEMRERCRHWIRCWGNGGGNYSTENSAVTAISESDSDIPRELARAIYDSIVDYCLPPFDASCLVMLLIQEVLDEWKSDHKTEEEDRNGTTNEVCESGD